MKKGGAECAPAFFLSLGVKGLLDGRLMAVASLVRPGSPLCDVGTDHAYLPVWLVEQGITPCAVACDVNERPLAAARRTVTEHGLAKRITLCQSNGLAAISPEAAQDIVMAGMGGELIAALLFACPWAKTGNRRFILQPMTRAPALRRLLCEQGFCIERELPVLDGGHRYTVMQIAFTGEITHPDELYLQVGRIAENQTEAAAAWLRGEERQLCKRAAGLGRKRDGEAEAARCAAMAAQIGGLAKKLEESTNSAKAKDEYQYAENSRNI